MQFVGVRPLGDGVARQEHEVGALGLRGDPVGGGRIKAFDDGVAVGQAGHAFGDHAAQVVEAAKNSAADDAFLVLEMVVDRADALAAGAFQVVDRRRLDAVGVEQAHAWRSTLRRLAWRRRGSVRSSRRSGAAACAADNFCLPCADSSRKLF